MKPQAPDTAEALDPNAPEFDSVADFVEYLQEEERTQFSWVELQALSYRHRRSIEPIRTELEHIRIAPELPACYTLMGRAKHHDFRGFDSWDNNRWSGNPMCGGSGYEQISGFAGKAG